MLASGNEFRPRSRPVYMGSVLQLWQSVSANTLLSVGREPIGPTRGMRKFKVKTL